MPSILLASPVPLRNMLRVAWAVILFTSGYIANLWRNGVLVATVTEPEIIWSVYGESIVRLVKKVI